MADPSGNALDGEWTDAVSTFPSGDGSAGGDFRFRMNVLPGDVNANGSVNWRDKLEMRKAYGKQADQAGYNPRADLDGNGIINWRDKLEMRKGYGASLPTDEPLPYLSGGAPAGETTRRHPVGLQSRPGARSRLTDNLLDDILQRVKPLAVNLSAV